MISKLTQEQAFLVAKKAFGLENVIESELHFRYNSGKYFGGIHKPLEEKVFVSFTAKRTDNKQNSKSYLVVVEIANTLDISIKIFGDNKKFEGLLPIKNQYFTQKFFIENDITPYVN